VPGLPSHSGASSFDSKGEIITSVHGNAAVFAVVRGIRSPLLSTPQTDETGDSGRWCYRCTRRGSRRRTAAGTVL